METKMCPKCKQELPATTEYFYSSNGRLKSSCKKCEYLYAKICSIIPHKQQQAIVKAFTCPMFEAILEKECKVCKQRFPATTEYFYSASRGLYGIENTCKQCDFILNKDRRDKYQANFRKNNKEKIQQWDKNWRDNNKDRKRETDLAWRTNNTERKAANDKRYYEQNRNKIIKRSQKYYYDNYELVKSKLRIHAVRWKRTNPEKVLAMASKRRAIKKCLYVEEVDYALLKKLYPICNICGELIDGEPHYDHVIPISRHGDFFMGSIVVSEHSYENIRPTHAFCNWSKHNKLMEEIYLDNIMRGNYGKKEKTGNDRVEYNQ